MMCNDKRGGRIVFVSHCILNQNTRFGGIAVQEGCIQQMVQGLCAAGIGIEQLPCPEMKYWGGVDRILAMHFLRLCSRFVNGDLKPPLSWILDSFLLVYRLLCTIEARRAAATVKRFISRGYAVLGIVVMNDSPTCGLNRTMDMKRFTVDACRKGIDLSCPAFEEMSSFLPEVLCGGSGFFVGAMMKRLSRVSPDINMLGFDPWSDNEREAARLLSGLLDGK